jgi:hypothetical protein
MVEMSDRRADEGPEPVPAPPVDEARWRAGSGRASGGGC